MKRVLIPLTLLLAIIAFQTNLTHFRIVIVMRPNV